MSSASRNLWRRPGQHAADLQVKGSYMDKRWQQLGDLLVNYATAVRPGERVMIAMGEVESLPLTEAVYAAAVRAGAYPQVQFLSETLRHALLKHGDEEQLRWVPEIEAYGMEWADVYIGLRGAYNLHMHSDIAAPRLSMNQGAMGRVFHVALGKDTLVPGPRAGAGVCLPG